MVFKVRAFCESSRLSVAVLIYCNTMIREGDDVHFYPPILATRSKWKGKNTMWHKHKHTDMR